jgi:hypothetical protein
MEIGAEQIDGGITNVALGSRLGIPRGPDAGE